MPKEEEKGIVLYKTPLFERCLDDLRRKGGTASDAAGRIDVRAAKHLMLVIGADSFGKEEELGRMLVEGFFETMKVTGEIPHTIFSLNAGVTLTTVNEEIIPVLKDLEAMGVEIFSCGTCLNTTTSNQHSRSGIAAQRTILSRG